jgi:nucleoside-diphosphate-sugar epimerase
VNILITGANGFVGQNLQEYLAYNSINSIHAFNLRQPLLSETINKADVIIHLAGKAHDLKKTSSADEYYQVNFELTKKLYNAFLSSDAKKFIFISSVKAATDEVEIILNEDILPQPKTHYGKSKLMAEQYIQNLPLPAGKKYYILRPCMIHGPGNKGNLNLLYNLVKKRIPYPLAAFNNKRSFLSVENLCFVIGQIVNRDDILTGIYHVADDDALSTNELIRIISTSINKKPLLWSISPKIIIGLAKIGDIIHLPLNTERLSKLTENYVVSNMKIKTVLGKELPVKSREGIVTTIKSFQ